MRKRKKLNTHIEILDGKEVKVPDYDSSHASFQRNNLKYTCPDFYDYIETHYLMEPQWMGRIFLHIHGMSEPPKCVNEGCDNYATFLSLGRGYQPHCSIKCGSNDPEVIAKIQAHRPHVEKPPKEEHIEILDGIEMKVPNFDGKYHNRLRWIVVKSNQSEFYQYILDTYPEGREWMEKLYMFFHRKTEIPKCPVCGKPVLFNDVISGWGEYCSIECSNSVYRVAIPDLNDLVRTYGDINDIRDVDEIPNPYEFTPVQLTDMYIARNYPKFYIYLHNRYVDYSYLSICAMMYMYFNGMDEPGKCRTCGKYTEFKSFGQGFCEYCCIKCLNEYEGPVAFQRMRLIYYHRSGYDHPSQDPAVREKTIQTNLIRYQCEHPRQNENEKRTYIQTRKNQFMDEYKKCISINDENWIGCFECSNPECTKCKERKFFILADTYRKRIRAGKEPCPILNALRNKGFKPSENEIEDRRIMEEIGIVCDYNRKSLIKPLELDISSKTILNGRMVAVEENGPWCHCIEIDRDSCGDLYHIRKWLMCYLEGIEMVTLWGNQKRDLKKRILETCFLGTAEEKWKLKEELFSYLKDNEWAMDLGWPPKGRIIQIKKHYRVIGKYLCSDSGVAVLSFDENPDFVKIDLGEPIIDPQIDRSIFKGFNGGKVGVIEFLINVEKLSNQIDNLLVYFKEIPTNNEVPKPNTYKQLLKNVNNFLTNPLD